MSYLKHTNLNVISNYVDNISNNSIPKIWNGNMYNNLRNKHLADERGNFEPCVRCVVL